MTDIMFSVPSDPEIEKVVVTGECVRENTSPTVIRRETTPSEA